MESNQYRAGALACQKAMQALSLKQWGDSSTSDDEYLAKRDAAIAELLATAGDLSPRAAGAMAALAEFVVGSEQDRSTYDLAVWAPFAAMTKEQQADMKKRLFAG